MVLPLVVLQFAANTDPTLCELCFPSAQALRQFLCCCLASFPVNITIGQDRNIVMLFPVLKGSGTKTFLIQMRLVDVGELHTIQREISIFMKESRLSIRWFGRPKTLLKKLLCFVINIVILPCPPIQRQTLFFLMPFNPVKLDRDRKLLDDISDDLNIVK